MAVSSVVTLNRAVERIRPWIGPRGSGPKRIRSDWSVIFADLENESPSPTLRGSRI